MNFDSFFVSRVSQPLFGRKPGELVRFWKTGQIQVLISKKITEEYLRVLAYPKFNLSEKEIGFLFNHEILPYFKAVRIKPGRWKTTIENDPSDDMFIRCAVSGMCKIIISDHISGDRHLLDFKTYDKRCARALIYRI